MNLAGVSGPAQRMAHGQSDRGLSGVGQWEDNIMIVGRSAAIPDSLRRDSVEDRPRLQLTV